MIFAYRNVDSPNGDFGLVKQEGDERFVVLTVEEYAALRETEARANTAKGDADLMRARAERAEALLWECRDHIPLVDPCPDHAIDDKECQPGIERADLLSRLDDALGGAS